MKRDLLEKEIGRALKMFKWKRRYLRLQIFFCRRKLQMVRTFSFLKAKRFVIQAQLDNLVYRMRESEEKMREKAFYRLYLREDL